MGLNIVVGGLADAARSSTSAEFEALQRAYVALNEVLADAGRPPHVEPLDIPDAEVFDARMMSISGLHLLRRLAAYLAFEDRLPPQTGAVVDESEDPVVERLYRRHDAYLQAPTRPARRWNPFARQRRPPFQHLLMHSDFEGFYVPQAFDDVLVDRADREGVGHYVGSTTRLLDECRAIARRIDLPPDIGPDDGRLERAVDTPTGGGPLWRAYGQEAHALACLIRGCEASLRHKAVLAFA